MKKEILKNIEMEIMGIRSMLDNIEVHLRGVEPHQEATFRGKHYCNKCTDTVKGEGMCGNCAS